MDWGGYPLPFPGVVETIPFQNGDWPYPYEQEFRNSSNLAGDQSDRQLRVGRGLSQVEKHVGKPVAFTDRPPAQTLILAAPKQRTDAISVAMIADRLRRLDRLRKPLLKSALLEENVFRHRSLVAKVGLFPNFATCSHVHA